MSSDFENWLDHQKFEGDLKTNEPLSKHTYFQIGGPARWFVSPRTREDLKVLSRGLEQFQLPFFVLGLGSNLLVDDGGFDGVVIKTHRLGSKIDVVESNKKESLIETGAGVGVSMLLRQAARKGWSGLEFLAGVPGSVGGAVFMNAGTHLGEAAALLEEVEVYSLIEQCSFQYTRQSMQYTYRSHRYIPKGSVVYRARWRVKNDSPEKVEQVIRETLARRKESQPIDLPCCGSVFKNPKGGHLEKGRHAWQVIDQLGLRGHRIGNAEFSQKHANFIVNLGGASAQDVRDLIALAKTRSKKELDIELEEEVRYL